MKILVYGAGVLGSYLAHVLVRGGNDVTMLARGQRVKELENDGIIISHYFQLKTTVDKVKVITTLLPEDVYDLIFVVMTYSDFQTVLPVLADNQSSHIVLVGNNADADAMQNYIKENSVVEKHVAFGMQLSGGHRKNGRIVCVRAGGGMELGGLDGALTWQPLLDKAFENAKYKLAYYENMDSWLKSHIVLILPLYYATCACDGDLRKATGDKKLLNQVIGALDEGFKVLETLGYTITPASQTQLVRKKRHMPYLALKFYTVTPLNRLVKGSHEEMVALNNAFDDLKRKANISTPNWDELEIHFPS
jgi:2-dehydropantoate 2-reductase